MKRLRVLIASHEFSPYQGSECAVGWNIATRMAALHDTTVLCAEGTALEPGLYSNAVADYLQKNGPIPGLRIVFVKHPPETIRLARINKHLMALTGGFGWQLLYYIGLDGWHREILKTVMTMGLEEFDALHQLTPISFLKPGYLWTLDKPFFWGPLGGMYKVPGTFARTSGMKSMLFETGRSANIERLIHTTRFVSIVRKAKRIWTTSEHEHHIINNITPDKAFPMIDTSPPIAIEGIVRQYDGEKPLRLCWSGLHEARKALPLLLKAIAGIPAHEKIELDILGTGPETQNWQNLAQNLYLKKITWHGRLPYREALDVMGRADVFVHTSYREAASMVVLEALGWGLPVICHDACGMAFAVNETCGIKVPFENPKISIQGFHDAIEKILHNPGLVEQFSKGALSRTSVLSWDAKVKEMAETYLKYV